MFNVQLSIKEYCNVTVMTVNSFSFHFKNYKERLLTAAAISLVKNEKLFLFSILQM